MTKKLSVTISGAVSLGSYEAGVMYEIIHAIGQHNKDPKTKGEEKIFIDVLVGASAGGMTSTILAQKLLYEAGTLDGAYTNALFSVWVKDVDISQLLKMLPGDNNGMSILSSKFIQQLSERYLTARYSTPPVLPRITHPASASAIRLGLALSNLNGVDYGFGVAPAGKFIYSRFEDEKKKIIDSFNPTCDQSEFWDDLRNAAVSCGAFPFAFRAVDVTRHKYEYTSPNLITPIMPNQNFCYTDGGTFHNEPLGMAKNLVDEIDPAHLEADNRYYLFVSPHEKKSVSSDQLNANNAEFIPFAKQLVAAVYAQSTFQDWVMVEKINQQIDLLDKRADELLIIFKSTANPGFLTSLENVAKGLLPILFPGINSINDIEAERSRLKVQFATEYNSLPADTGDIYIDTILVLETAASLGHRDKMKILGITASDSELSGADLFSFGGFFDFKYRKHDYDVGRKKAQDFLTNPACPLGKLNFIAEPVDPIDASLNGLTIDKMDEGIRKNFYGHLKTQVLDTMSKAGMGYIKRTAIYEIIIGPRLKKILKL